MLKNGTGRGVMGPWRRAAAIALGLGLIVAFPAAAQQGGDTAAPPAATTVQDTPAQATPPASPELPQQQAPFSVMPEAGGGLPGGEVSVNRSTLPHDLSPWGMFMAADWVVKAVMIGLAFASLVTWTVWLAKSIELATAKARAGKALHRIVASRSLADASRAIGKRAGAAGLLVRAAEHEVALSADILHEPGGAGLKERITSHLGRIEAQAGRQMTRGTGVLATIGSTAPFVGLFGTVWGIMNSFIGISEAQTTNLAIVAPGIAEALLATAIGLVAAIPAVVIYNVFARSITGYRQILADASAAVERLVSRDIDRRTLRAPAMARAAE